MAARLQRQVAKVRLDRLRRVQLRELYWREQRGIRTEGAPQLQPEVAQGEHEQRAAEPGEGGVGAPELGADGRAHRAHLEEALQPIERRPAEPILEMSAKGRLRVDLIEGHWQLERATPREQRVEGGEAPSGGMDEQAAVHGPPARLRTWAEQPAARSQC